MHRQLPTDKQIEGGTHVKVVQRTVYEKGTNEIQVELEYGTEDSDGNFVPRSKTPNEEVIIRDRKDYENSTAEHNAPSTKGDPLNHAASDVLDYIEKNEKWPNP